MGNIVLIAKIVLALLNVVETIMRKVDQVRWEQLGYDKAVRESLARIAANLKSAEQAHEDAGKKTDTQLDDVLRS